MQLTKQEWFRAFAIILAADHKEHCPGATCNVSLGAIREMAEAAGAVFSEDDKQLFI
jgi:hypothetical protein